MEIYRTVHIRANQNMDIRGQFALQVQENLSASHFSIGGQGLLFSRCRTGQSSWFGLLLQIKLGASSLVALLPPLPLHPDLEPSSGASGERRGDPRRRWEVDSRGGSSSPTPAMPPVIIERC
nr:PREDICTED: uncharacterized protein LOC103981776 isoform X2 [Musa acuminata subsp. malaccensis]